MIRIFENDEWSAILTQDQICKKWHKGVTFFHVGTLFTAAIAVINVFLSFQPLIWACLMILIIGHVGFLYCCKKFDQNCKALNQLVQSARNNADERIANVMKELEAHERSIHTKTQKADTV